VELLQRRNGKPQDLPAKLNYGKAPETAPCHSTDRRLNAVQDYPGKEASDAEDGTSAAGLLSGGEREKADHFLRAAGAAEREADQA